MDKTLTHSPWTTLKPGSHMPLTYGGHSCRHGLGHCYGIFEHLPLNHNLSQALTASLPVQLSWVQLCWQAGGCWQWKNFMWTSSAEATYSSKTIWSIFTGKMVENCAIRFVFRTNLSTLAIHRRCVRNPLGQIGAEHCRLQPATTLQVGQRDMRTRLNGLPLKIDLITVFNAIFMGSQSGQKLKHLYGNPMTNNIFQNWILHILWIKTWKLLGGRLYSPSLEDVAWPKDDQLIFPIFHTFVCNFFPANRI